MITCSCGKAIEKIPNWLQGVKVDFICNNCPNRTTKNIAFVTLPVEVKAVGLEDEDDVEIDEVVDDEE